MRKGLLVTVFKYLEVAKSTLKDYERVVVLLFNEVKVKSVLETDKQTDKIVEPHASSYRKQTVYIEFDKKMTKIYLSQ